MKRSLLISGLLIALIAFLGLAIYYASSAEITGPEASHLLGSRETMRGAVPFRDFAYTKMLFVPYLSGIGMWLIGFGFIAERVINLVVAAIGLFVIALILRRRFSSLEPGLTACFIVCASPHFISTVTIECGVAWASMFVALALFFALQKTFGRGRLLFFSSMVVLALGCELSTLPSVLLLTVIYILETENRRERIISSLTLLFVFTSAVVLFRIGFAGKMAFYTWSYYRLQRLDRPAMLIAAEWWQLSPAVILTMTTGLFSLPFLVRKRRCTEIALLVTATLGLLIPLLPAPAVVSDVAANIPLAALAGVHALWQTGSFSRNPLRYALWLFPAIALVYPLPRLQSDLTFAEMDEVARVLKADAPPGPVLTPLPAIAVLARREVLKGTELGMYSVMAREDENRARWLRMTTLPQLVDHLKQKKPAAVVEMRHEIAWNFRWQMPAKLFQPRDLHRQFTKALHSHYRRIHRTETMLVYIPKR